MNTKKKFACYTLGCKLNFSESSTIARQLIDKGFIKTEFDKKADLYIINTCSVTENANRECRRIIRKAKKNSPNSFIIVTGCYAQLKPEEISKIIDVDLILGANEKFNLPEILLKIKTSDRKKMYGCDIENLSFFSSYSLFDRTRSFLKIQDGCDYPCTYCTIPLARGKSRCDNVRNIVENAKIIANKGIKEIVITGVNIGEFKDENNNNFSKLIKELDKVSGIDRYRISSIEPNRISNDIIDTVKNSEKFMPHFHIPLQSGSDYILSRMKRRYNTKLYSKKISKITNEISDVCIGADVIVGFPGETKEEFNKTLNFIKESPLSYLHVFSYSERENTAAIKLDGFVEKKERLKRSKQLRILSEKLRRAFYHKYNGTTHNVLFEQENRNGMLYGFSDNYIKVKIKYNADICKTQQRVILNQIDTDGIMNAKII